MHAVLAIAIATILALAAPAHAQDWPQRPVTIVVPFAAGGSADLLARILQQHMQVKFGVPFVVENRSGAGGSIGTGVVAKAPPDGYTLLLGTLSGNVINGFLYTKLPYDVERDFQPVSLLVHLPNLLVVNTKLSAKTVPELIEPSQGKRRQGELWLVRQRNLVASFGRDVPARKRHQDDPCAVPQHGGRIEQHGRRAHRSRHRQHDDALAAGSGGRGAGDCRHQRETCPNGPGTADHWRDAQWIFSEWMARRVRSRRNPATDRR